MSCPAGDSTVLRGFDTSITLPCGPVPLLGSFLRDPSLFALEPAGGADSLPASGIVICVMDNRRGSAVAVTAGEVMEAEDEDRDLFTRFAGFC